MNIFNIIYESTITFIQEAMLLLTYKIDSILNINDITLTIFLSLFIISYSVFYLVTRIATVFNPIAFAFSLSLIISLFFSTPETGLYELALDKAALQSGLVIVPFLFLFSFGMLIKNNYYKRLFGRE